MQDKRQKWAQSARNSETAAQARPLRANTGSDAEPAGPGSTIRVAVSILAVILIGIGIVMYISSKPTNAHAAPVAADTTHKVPDTAKKP